MQKKRTYLLAHSLTFPSWMFGLHTHLFYIYILSSHIYHFSACLIAFLHPHPPNIVHSMPFNLLSPYLVFVSIFLGSSSHNSLIISCWNAVTKDKRAVSFQSHSLCTIHKIDVHFDICKVSVKLTHISIDRALSIVCIVIVFAHFVWIYYVYWLANGKSFGCRHAAVFKNFHLIGTYRQDFKSC